MNKIEFSLLIIVVAILFFLWGIKIDSRYFKAKFQVIGAVFFIFGIMMFVESLPRSASKVRQSHTDSVIEKR